MSYNGHNMKKPTSFFKNYLSKPCFLSFTIFFSHFVLSNATEISSYSDYCSSVVQEATFRLQPFPLFPLGHRHTGYRCGDDGIFGPRSSDFLYSFTFQAKNAYSTDTEGVIRVEAVLEFPRPYSCNYERSIVGGEEYCTSFPGGIMQKRLLRFWLDGFWSESSGRLCLVGSADFDDLKAVLKLDNVRNSSTITSLITGTFESFSSGNDSNSFEPISILMIPGMNYEYTLVDTEFEDQMNEGGGVKSLPLQFPESICNKYSGSNFEFSLKYSKNCDSWKDCSPFPGAVEDLPLVVSISGSECLRKKPRLRVLLSFSKTSSGGSYPLFYPKNTLIGEAFWDRKRIFVVACRFLDVTDTIFNARVADCSTRLSMWLPAKLSIRETRIIVGQIWSNKTANDSGYFSRIRFQGTEDFIPGVSMEYEYTEVDKVRISCLQRQPDKNGGKIYPNRSNSADMKFDMTVRKGTQRIAWGYATPFSVSDEYFYLGPFVHLYYRDPGPQNAEITVSFQNSNLVNVSYKIGMKLLSDARLVEGISLFNSSSILRESVEISAEGIYNEETGDLCMVGCRNLGKIIQTDEVDCEILVKFQFPPLQGNDNESYVKGTIESTRKSSDPMYFEPLEVSSAAYTETQAGKYIRRMDRETAMSLVSSTLGCVFTGLQHLHVKSHPEVLPSISVATILVLSLGHFMNLVKNFDASLLENIHLKNHFLGYESVEFDGVIIGIVRMVAFSMQVRLVQRIWSARSRGEEKHFWSAETAAAFLSVPLYVAGALSAMLMKWNTEGNLNLTSCTEFIVNGFLLPQILLNIARDSEEKALYHFFYIGSSFLQLLPHACNLNRAYIYIVRFSGIYTDASVWDVFISLWSVFFAAIIFLQQQFGGGFMLPQRFRDREAHRHDLVMNGL